MDFAGYNSVAIFVAAIASFLFGGVWYGVLSERWLNALGKTEQEVKSATHPMPVLLGLTVVAQLVMAFVLAGIIGHLGSGQVTIWNGLISGLLVWIGFVITTLVVNHGYQGSNWSLTLIDGVHWLGVLLIQGAVIGFFGV